MDQWYTAVEVTSPIRLGLSHFQNTTCSAMVWAFIRLFSSMLKICSASLLVPGATALSAITFATGFISALSAVIGRRSGCPGLAVSTITTLFAAPVSRTQMNLSDLCRGRASGASLSGGQAVGSAGKWLRDALHRHRVEGDGARLDAQAHQLGRRGGSTRAAGRRGAGRE